MVKLKRLSIVFLVTLIFLFSGVSGVEAAGTIQSIDIVAEIQDDGSVIITDHRKFTAPSGTEHYIALGNLPDSKLESFQVYEKGVPLTYEPNWNINGSIDDKRGKYGVNKTSNGMELCFGIGEYGKRDFTLVYKLTNFVMNLKDGKQATYWQFINPDMDPIDKVNIKVTNNKGFVFSKENTKIWGFGYEGKTEITPQMLTLSNEKQLNRSNYMVMLSIFPEKTFNATYNYNKTSQDLENQAKIGSDFNSSNKNSGIISKILSGIGFFVAAIISIISSMGFIVLFAYIFISTIGSRKAKKSFKTDEKYEYYREIPYEGHFLDTASITEYDDENWVSALILKWIKENKIEVLESEKGIFFKRKSYSLKLNDDEQIEFSNSREKELWKIFRQAAGGNHLVEEDEFDEYMKDNYAEFTCWESLVRTTAKDKALNNGWTEERETKLMFIKSKNIYATEKGRDFLDKVIGFENYLLDFSLLNERESMDVKLWEDYMIWASYMGIAEKVEKQFKKLNPAYVPYGNDDVSYVYVANTISHNLKTSVSSQISSSSSSGGGGYSSSGGGGGSFGGSSGGGTR